MPKKKRRKKLKKRKKTKKRKKISKKKIEKKIEKELVYKTKKYGIPCERKFEINTSGTIIGFSSSGCI